MPDGGVRLDKTLGFQAPSANVKLTSPGKLVITQAITYVESFTGTTDTITGIQLDSALSAAQSGFRPFIIILFAAPTHTITVENSTGAQLSCGQDVELAGSKGLVLWQADSGDNGFRDLMALPDLTGGIVDLASIQTLENKIYASPLITGAPEIHIWPSGTFTDSEQKLVAARLTTSDATVTTAIDLPALAESTSIVVEFLVQGRLAAGGAGIGAKIEAMARRGSGGDITLVWSEVRSNEDSSGTPAVTVDVDIGTQKLRPRIAGVAAETWYWSIDGFYIRLQTSA